MKSIFSIFFILTVSSAFGQLNLKTSEAYNKVLTYDFKDYVAIHLTFSSDTTLYWIADKSGTNAHEKIKTIHLNEYTTQTGWFETDGTIVSLYSDFKNGLTYGYQFFKNGNSRKLIGTIKLKK
jgi:hypothetical protein